MINPEYINKLTEKFAAARKLSSFINQTQATAPTFPGASMNVGQFMFDNAKGEKERVDQVSTYDWPFPVPPTFQSQPINDAPGSVFFNPFPASNAGTRFSNWLDGERTPNATSTWAEIGDETDTLGALINSGVTGLGYGGAASLLRRMGNAGMIYKNTGQLINPLASLRSMDPKKIDAVFSDMGIPADGNRVAFPGVRVSSEADKAFKKRQAIAEYVHLQSKNKDLTPGEYAEYRIASEAKPGLTLEQFRATRPASHAGTGRLGHHHRTPAGMASASGRPIGEDVDLGKNIEITHGSDKSKTVARVPLNGSPLTRSRLPKGAGKYWPALAALYGAMLPAAQNSINFGRWNPELVPLEDALPGIPHIEAPIADQSVRDYIRRSLNRGVTGYTVDFNEPDDKKKPHISF
jgi:hypothetical protein